MNRDSSTRRPTKAEAIDAKLAKRLEDLNCCKVGVVTKWDAGQQKCSVRVMVRRAYLDEADERQTIERAEVVGVPLVFPRGGKWRVTFPISDGNLVIEGEPQPATRGVIFYSDESLDRYLSSGAGTKKPVDPELDHSHHAADAIFVPGLYPFGDALEDVPTDHMTVGVDGGIQVHIRPSVVVVCGDPDSEAATNFVALANLVNDRLTTIQAKYDVHKHAAGVPNTGPPDVTIGTLASVAAGKLKTE